MTGRKFPSRLPDREHGPRRARLTEGVLVLPPASLIDLPPDAVVGHFIGVLALRFKTAEGPAAVFVHDLKRADVDRLLEAQRRQAEAQLGKDYARRALWWEAQPW